MRSLKGSAKNWLLADTRKGSVVLRVLSPDPAPAPAGAVALRLDGPASAAVCAAAVGGSTSIALGTAEAGTNGTPDVASVEDCIAKGLR